LTVTSALLATQFLLGTHLHIGARQVSAVLAVDELPLREILGGLPPVGARDARNTEAELVLQHADEVIAAGYLKGTRALDLARAFEGIVLVVASFVPRGSPELLRRGGVPAMLGGERGQYVAAIDADEETGLCQVKVAIYETPEKIGCVSDWNDECHKIDEDDRWIRVGA